jgi:hypothetical protein
MIPARRSIRALAGALLLASAAVSLSTCGGIGGSEFAGGGTGGTGISTGSISGFGSVVMNGVHFRTDNNVAPGFVTKKFLNGKDNSGRTDRDVFAVGMIVTVRHGVGDNNALEIEYRDNLQGPVAKILPGVENVLEILGQTVVVDNVTFFASVKQYDVVEVSGYADNAGRIRAMHLFSLPPPMPPPAQEFELKGFVSGSSLTGFRLGPLPDGSGVTVTVSYGPSAVAGLPGGPANGMYVEVVTTDPEPVGGVLTAVRIVKLAARTEFPDHAAVDLEGLVTAPPGGSGKILSFAVEGKRIRTDDATDFTGHSPAEIQPNTRLLVQGTEAGGVLSAVEIIFR